MPTLPDNANAAMAVLTELTELERSSRRAVDDLLKARDKLIAEAMARQDISPTELAKALGFRRQWLYQIAARGSRSTAATSA